ncbi:MAG: putative transcriptional regulator [Candidatus Azotimanducaceae bacterium]|jgi:putative transcriptional regulator
MAAIIPVANSVRELREQRGQMTQADLGGLIGVTRQTIAAIEKRQYSPSLESAFRIAHVLDMPINEVFYWEK